MSDFKRLCRACEQIERDAKKNADRPAAIIERRAASAASKAGVPKSYFMTNLNHVALVPILRAMMSPEGLCTSCGHPFLNERDIQIEHRAPPRYPQDWARHHARNLGFNCTSCNGTKSNKAYESWLDEQEDARQSNEADRASQSFADPVVPVQLSFDG